MTIRMCKGPGKFEGEPLYVRWFWEAALEGGADGEYGNYVMFQGTDKMGLNWIFDYGDGVSPNTEERFHLQSLRGVILWETEQGFVYHVEYEDAEEFQKVWNGILSEEVF